MNPQIHLQTIETPKGAQKWTAVDLPWSGNSGMVAVFPAIQTDGGSDTATIRLRNVTTAGFEFILTELQGHTVTGKTEGQPDQVFTSLQSANWHNAESVSFVAYCWD